MRGLPARGARVRANPRDVVTRRGALPKETLLLWQRLVYHDAVVHALTIGIKRSFLLEFVQWQSIASPFFFTLFAALRIPWKRETSVDSMVRTA